MMCSKREIGKIIIRVVIALGLLLCAQFLSFFLSETLPRGIEFSSFEAGTVTFEALQKVKKEMPEAFISSFSSEDVLVSTEFRKEPYSARMIYTDDKYPFLHPVEMVRGVFFSLENQMQKKNTVVISTDLAGKLFRTWDVLDIEIKINQESYRIVGVYKPDVSPLSQIASDGKDKIFTSYFSSSKGASRAAEQIYFLPSYSEDVSSAIAEQELYFLLSGDLRPYERINYLDKIRITETLPELQRMFLYLIFLFYIVRWICGYLSKGAFKKRNVLDSQTFLQWLRQHFLFLFSIIFTVCVIFLISRVVIWIPAAFTDKYQLFSPSFYWSEMLQSFQIHNGQKGFLFYSNLYFYAMWIYVVLFGWGIVAFWKVCHLLFTSKKSW